MILPSYTLKTLVFCPGDAGPPPVLPEGGPRTRNSTPDVLLDLGR